jgi:hypothetical protein
MQPWAVLSRREGQPAATTLLLDYVSLNAASAFIKSMRLRHFPVTLSILGTILLKALIVVSTTLFLLHVQLIERRADFTSSAIFDTARYNSSLVQGVPALVWVG